uniref:Uncharacterized protein n=1 Tax=Meloidogyne enterolobii TaxID=390850 RepID=A0A6V7V502_MELEN|nr:unnamed protein product [Meloidogyne enterolobii]
MAIIKRKYSKIKFNILLHLLFSFLFVFLFTSLTSSWSIEFPSPSSSSTLQEEELPLHPLSPPERLPKNDKKIITKRQAYQVYLGGEASVSIDKGAEDSGPWGEWTKERDCSRSCGGGVLIERRLCSDNTCQGPSIRYISCNIEPCPVGTKDFRYEQCSQHNDDPLDGKYYKWIPYAGKNKCELTCRPENANFYYKFAEKVVDGTKCDAYSDDVCVDANCLPVGCDGKLGSVAKKDKCGVCNGDGSACKTVEGIFDERGLALGYHDIVSIPVGATAIHIEELRPSSNVFAIKNSTGDWLLNGNYQIQVITKNIIVGGSAFKYEKGDSGTEKLTSNGPLTEPLTISLLLQRTTTPKTSSAVKYEFSIPLEKDIKYLWKPGNGLAVLLLVEKVFNCLITRTLYCTDVATHTRVEDSICEEQNATKPEFEKPCKTIDCEPQYFVGEWEPCSSTCGDKGLQFRVLYCHRVFADGRRTTVSDGNCTERGIERPEARRQCNRFPCPEWQAGPWSSCSSQCGDAKQFRSVTCRSAKEGEGGKMLPADACPDKDGKPQTERDCNLGPCKGLQFKTTDWELCQRCNDTEERRNVTCQDRNGREYPLEKCLETQKIGATKKTEKAKIPEDKRPCASPAPCLYEWHFSQWSKCSTECGHGHKSRAVFCAINELGQTKRVDESLCGGDKPISQEECLNEEKCEGVYFTGPWSECSASCNGGIQTRAVVCLNYDKKPVPEWCDERMKPIEQQICNNQTCPVCSESEFGCCLDNTTFATGQFYAGCSNCSISEFGCCSDNITEKQGKDNQGCPGSEDVEEEGSGEEPMEGEGIKEELCTLESQTGERLQIPCTTIAPSVVVGDLLKANVSENETINCSKTEFGCCPDWYTPAEGPELAGCPVFTLGTCNETKYGCCSDGVTLSRGPDFQGCGEPTCAASLYGCCKDRRTIAFGPNYGGCERSSLSCELTEFGCCPDGTTPALGKNGKGCGASCLLTRYGCCPDGITHAKGPDNDGCGCVFSQYGCCPDGKNSAKGPGFMAAQKVVPKVNMVVALMDRLLLEVQIRKDVLANILVGVVVRMDKQLLLGHTKRAVMIVDMENGSSKAFGPDFAGCPTTTPAPYMLGGTVSPSTIVASCGLPQDQGQVCSSSYKLAWYYDMAEARCAQFWYGGCGGNENRFGTQEQCEQICVDPPGLGRCYLPKVEGSKRCEQLTPRYSYDYISKQCTAFWHTGCLGNSNNFLSWEECQSFCAGADASQVQVNIVPYRGPIPISPQHNLQPPLIPQQQLPQQPPPPPHHHHNHLNNNLLLPLLCLPSQKKVELYPTLRPQPLIIPPKKPEISPFEEDDACRMMLDSGNCRSYVDKYYFDAFNGGCFRFIYSGCGGNRNRFNTESECTQRCGHLISSPTKPGFLGHKQQLQPLPSAHRTNAPLPGKQAFLKTKEMCNLRPDVGKCEGHFDSFYYELATGQCERFTYSGCGGNANRFNTLDECQAVCLRRHDFPPPPGPQTPFKSVSAFVPPEPSQPIIPAAAGSIIQLTGREKQKNQQQICDYSKETGSCKQFVTKWYYNKSDGTCNRFHYGGIFKCFLKYTVVVVVMEIPIVLTQNKNVEILVVILEMPVYCQVFLVLVLVKLTVIIFDFHSNKCSLFQYGGCLGNTNNFRTIEECQARCQPNLKSRRRRSLLSEQQFVEINNNSNTDNLLINKNEKNILNKQKEDVFVDEKEEEIGEEEEEEGGLLYGQLPELCLLPEERGKCFGEILRFRYDIDKNDCVGFFYTGCAQNVNNFLSYESCLRACGDWKNKNICELEYDGGSKECENENKGNNFGLIKIQKWYYVPSERKCKLFMWNGCGGNGNRFQSKSECENLCNREIDIYNQQLNICQLPMDGGPCEDFVSLWYFDYLQNQCRRFTFGGCRGNSNRFLTEEDCLLKCNNLTIINNQQLIKQKTTTISINSKQIPKRAKIFVFPLGTLIEGNNNNLNFKCLIEKGEENNENRDFYWYKNGMEFLNGNYENDGNNGRVLLQKINSNNSLIGELKLININIQDKGLYSCAYGDSLISEEIKINIIKNDLIKNKYLQNCIEEKRFEQVCRNILNLGLCNTLRYGSFCCKTCKK